MGFPEEAQERLLVEAAQSDPSKFASLYEENFERVYAFAARRANTREEAEDVTSEVFQKALANLPRFKWRGVSFASWLLRIAGNLIADRYKTSVREGARSSVDDLAELAATEDRETQESLEAIERQAALFRLVRELPEDQRRVIVMRFAEDKSIREIATELGRTEGAVKQLQFRGVQTLRAGLGEANG
ncbi:MAG: RNA polymerase sigma factor [bacterium]